MQRKLSFKFPKEPPEIVNHSDSNRYSCEVFEGNTNSLTLTIRSAVPPWFFMGGYLNSATREERKHFTASLSFKPISCPPLTSPH